MDHRRTGPPADSETGRPPQADAGHLGRHGWFRRRGENSHTAAARELREELGIETAGEDLRFAGRIRRRNSFTDIWVLRRDVELSSLRLQTEEVAQAKWVTRTELMDMVARRTFHHYGRPYFELVLQALYPGEG